MTIATYREHLSPPAPRTSKSRISANSLISIRQFVSTGAGIEYVAGYGVSFALWRFMVFSGELALVKHDIDFSDHGSGDFTNFGDDYFQTIQFLEKCVSYGRLILVFINTNALT